uniref:G-protein coupled receptors family 1 profile domain-containing protein n=1 Tax=Panagrolaimus sp. PS1159 TaxID=55785 RepID=A0AC35GVK5_9BILA
MDSLLKLGYSNVKVNENYLQSPNLTEVALLIHKLTKNREECENIQVPFACESTKLYRNLMGYGFFVVFILSIVGNCLNLFIYNSDQIRFYIAIRMLCTKLLMNTLMMVLLVPQALRIMQYWEPGSKIDQLYWKLWPYQAYCLNVFGFCAMWLTVLMTAECYVHVFFPSQSKTICTKRNVSKGYLAIAIVGMLLSLIYPFNRKIHFYNKCELIIVKIRISETFWMRLYEKIHTVANLFLAIVIPLTLLVFMTASIVWKLIIRGAESGIAHRFSAEKRCVTRITLITTLLQLVTEFPSIPVFLYAVCFGPHLQQICNWQTMSHFFGLWNASLSFFVYITFSTRFRKSICRRVHQVFHQCCPNWISRPSELPKLRTCSSFVSHGDTCHRPLSPSAPNKLGFYPPPNSAAESLLSFNLETQTYVCTTNGYAGVKKQSDSSCVSSPSSSVNDSFL